MGAISRSGLKRLVIGNIAEQVLDALPCDVLVLKPADVPHQGAEQGSGRQVDRHSDVWLKPAARL